MTWFVVGCTLKSSTSRTAIPRRRSRNPRRLAFVHYSARRLLVHAVIVVLVMSPSGRYRSGPGGTDPLMGSWDRHSALGGPRPAKHCHQPPMQTGQTPNDGIVSRNAPLPRPHHKRFSCIAVRTPLVRPSGRVLRRVMMQDHQVLRRQR